MLTEIIGYIAGACVIGSMIPQIVKSWKTKSTKDISLLRYIVYICGIILWLIYSIIIMKFPMIVSNLLALFFAFSILYLKIKYK